jgi:hypothetical protein
LEALHLDLKMRKPRKLRKLSNSVFVFSILIVYLVYPSFISFRIEGRKKFHAIITAVYSQLLNCKSACKDERRNV